VKPEKGLVERKKWENKKKLTEIQKSMSITEINALLKINKKLQKRQSITDSEVLLDKIPSISLNDINRLAEDFSINSVINNDLKIKYHIYKSFTNGIVFVRMYFDVAHLPQQLIHYAKTLTFLLGKISTKVYNIKDMSLLRDFNTGGINYEYRAFENYDDIDSYKPYFIVTTKSMVSKIDITVEMINEIMQNSVFDDPARIKRILSEEIAYIESIFTDASSSYTRLRLSVYFSKFGRFREEIDGLEYYYFLRDLLKNFNKNKEEIMNIFTQTYRLIFNGKGTIISITGSSQDISKTMSCFNRRMNEFPQYNNEQQIYSFTTLTQNEAFIIPTTVNFVAKGYFNNDIKYSGEFEIVEQIILLDYLWKSIRTQGGAYGVSFEAKRNGEIIAMSSQDPNIVDTLKVFDEIPKFLKNFKTTDKDFHRYIIGTIRKFEEPKQPFNRSCIVDSYCISGRKQEFI
jgi:Zn-dependent M16 (insulinase) family peptidase